MRPRTAAPTVRSRALAALLLGALALAGPPARGAAERGSADLLREAVERWLLERLPGEEHVVELPALDDFELPGVAPERVEVRLSANPRQELAGSVPLTAVLLVDGAEARRGTLTARVRALAPVLVAARALPKGTVLREGDVREERRDRAALPPGALGDLRFAVGQQLTRSLRAGTLLTEPLLVRPTLVARGQVVEVRYQRGALRIEGRGLAREDGRAGDLVRVENPSSQRVVTGRVDPAGVVHVEF
jgi:flagella basal body P-ring formation protein FlgA